MNGVTVHFRVASIFAALRIRTLRGTMIRAIFLLVLLLAVCSEAKPSQSQAVNQMIESPLQNTVVSSFDTYPPRPVTDADRAIVLGCDGNHISEIAATSARKLLELICAPAP